MIDEYKQIIFYTYFIMCYGSDCVERQEIGRYKIRRQMPYTLAFAP